MIIQHVVGAAMLALLAIQPVDAAPYSKASHMLLEEAYGLAYVCAPYLTHGQDTRLGEALELIIGYEALADTQTQLLHYYFKVWPSLDGAWCVFEFGASLDAYESSLTTQALD